MLVRLILIALLFACTKYGAYAGMTGDFMDRDLYDRAASNSHIRDHKDDDCKKKDDYSDSDCDDDHNRLTTDRIDGGDGHHNDDRSGCTDDRFNGGELKVRASVDTDFQKRAFRDLSVARQRLQEKSDFHLRVNTAVSEDNDGSVAAHLKPRSAADSDQFFRKLTESMEDLLTDWVPSKADPLDNGGFGTAEDNGAPVPYRLSGHVDIERGLPWEPKD